MSYFNVLYAFVALPILVALYNIVPKKIRPILLLLASYAFFFSYSKFLIVFVMLSSLSIYLAGRKMSSLESKKKEKLEGLEKEEKKAVKETYQKNKRNVLVFTIIFNAFFLFIFKYLGFFVKNTNHLVSFFGGNNFLPIIKLAAPIGISFYTLQAISYLVDIYREKIEAEKKLLKVMLYLSFFPTVVEGPITRYGDIKDTIYEGTRVTYQNFCFGYQRILFGFFKKMVIADRLNIFVKIIFTDYMSYSGPAIFLGAIFYTILLYMEFSGTMDVVIGSAEMFGITLPENFRQPFFSKNISEFWSRWHISLGQWFKDYIFYPVSLSKPVKKLTTGIKKTFGNRVSSLTMGGIALFAVWSLNGLWHGAGYQYLFFGYYHFTLILLGNIFEPWIVAFCTKAHINRKSIPYRIFQTVKTCILVFIGELFFRADGLRAGFSMMKRILTDFQFHHIGREIASLGLDIKDYIVLAIALLFVLGISILRERRIPIREKISKKPLVLRWTLYYVLIFAILIFGAYGKGYVPVAPIYADF